MQKRSILENDNQQDQYQRVLQVLNKICRKRASIFKTIAKKDQQLADLQSELKFEFEALIPMFDEGWKANSIGEVFSRQALAEHSAYDIGGFNPVVDDSLEEVQYIFGLKRKRDAVSTSGLPTKEAL